MNVRKRVKVDNKKNNDFLSVPCYALNLQCLSKKISIEEKKKKKERKEQKCG